jgi:hypothetical protein
VDIEVTPSGDMRVRGQNNTDQCILVQEVLNGVLRFSNPVVDAGGITTFNGQAVLIVSGVFGDIRFDLKSGRKLLILCEGNQTDFDVFGDLRITTSGSDDAIVIADDIDVDGTTDIRTKNGNDAILLIDCDFRDRTKISTGNGDDVVAAQPASDFFGECEIQTGGGNDFTLFTGTQFALALAIKLGSGEDGIGFNDCCIEDESELNGNGGLDTLVDEDNDFQFEPIIKSIEELDDFFGAFFVLNNLAKDIESFDAAVAIAEILNLGP